MILVALWLYLYQLFMLRRKCGWWSILWPLAVLIAVMEAGENELMKAASRGDSEKKG